MYDDSLLLGIAQQLSSPKNGAYLPEAELAGRMNLSRMHIREVLSTMNAYGMIEKRQKFGVRLCSDKYDVKSIYELRALLEGYAMPYVLEKITPEDIEELKLLDDLIEFGKSRKDYDMMKENDAKFHLKLIQIADIPLLSNMMRQINLIHFSFTGTLKSSEKKTNPWKHSILLEALQKKSPECIEIIRKHIEWSLNNNFPSQV